LWVITAVRRFLPTGCDQPEAFGWTASGKYITVVYEGVSDDPLTVYPIPACEVPPPGARKKRRP
jgi:hypothetical protein